MPEEDLFDGWSNASRAGDPDSRQPSSAHVTVTLSGEWDLARREACGSFSPPLPAMLIVDLGEVTFFDSSAIGVVVGARNRLAADNGGLQLRVGGAATSYGARWRRWDCPTGSSISSNRRDALRGAPPEPAVRTTRTCHRP